MLPEHRIAEADNAAYIASRKYKWNDPQTLDDWHSQILETVFINCTENFTTSQIEAYAFTCAKHLQLNEWKTIDRINHLLTNAQLKDEDADELSLSNLDTLPTYGRTPEEEVIARETYAETMQALKALPEEQAAVIVLCLNGEKPKSKRDAALYKKFYKTRENARIALVKASPTIADYYKNEHRIARAYNSRHYCPYSMSDHPRGGDIITNEKLNKISAAAIREKCKDPEVLAEKHRKNHAWILSRKHAARTYHH